MGVAVLFPGQGAQAPGLGKPWQDQPEWALVERLEAATGHPIGELLLDAPAEALARTREAQLAVFAASLLAWEAAGPHLRGQAVAYAGHSLGQVTALVAAGALTLEDGARLAARRAEVTQNCADGTPQRMAALLGATDDQLAAALAAAPDACWLANENADGQLVVAGTPEGVEAVSAAAKEAGVKRVVPLNVGGAFHTPLMQPAADAFAPVVAATEFADTAVPVVANTDAEPYTDGAGWRDRLVAHLTIPVRWRRTMPRLVELGATSFVEVGPGTTLTGLAKRAVPGVELTNIAVPADTPQETR